MWNYPPTRDLAKLKAGEISDEEDFLNKARHNFTEFYQPLVPWVNEHRREVFPGVVRWKVEGLFLDDRMRDVLERAMEDPFVKANWQKERRCSRLLNMDTQRAVKVLWVAGMCDLVLGGD